MAQVLDTAAAEPPPRRYQRSEDRPAVLDLAKRWGDVRAIAKSRPEFRACLDAGWDADDLLSELAERILRRQDLASAYDPKRACVSKYLSVICRSILLNLLDSAKRKARHEQIGSYDSDGDACDAALVAVGTDGRVDWTEDDDGGLYPVAPQRRRPQLAATNSPEDRPMPAPRKPPDHTASILVDVRTHPGTSASASAGRLGLDRKVVGDVLRGLLANNHVSRVGEGTSQAWYVVEVPAKRNELVGASIDLGGGVVRKILAQSEAAPADLEAVRAAVRAELEAEVRAKVEAELRAEVARAVRAELDADAARREDARVRAEAERAAANTGVLLEGGVAILRHGGSETTLLTAYGPLLAGLDRGRLVEELVAVWRVAPVERLYVAAVQARAA